MSAGRKQIALAAAIVALVAGFRGPVQAAPTTVTVPNYNFQSYDEAVRVGSRWSYTSGITTPVPDGQMTPYTTSTQDSPSMWLIVTGMNNRRTWNPSSADYPTAAGSGALPGTAAGSQCFINISTDSNGTNTTIVSGTAAVSGPSPPGRGSSWPNALCYARYDTRYTVTVAFGSWRDIMNGNQLGFGDFTQMVEGTLSGTLLPNGWHNCGSGNPQNMNGFQGWGGFGDISYSLTCSPQVMIWPLGPPPPLLFQAGDGIGVDLHTTAGTCWTNVRLISQNWTPAYAAGR